MLLNIASPELGQSNDCSLPAKWPWRIWLKTTYTQPQQNNKTGELDHVDVIKWNHSPCYWPFVRGIHRSPVTSPHKGQWHGAPLIYAWTNSWVNNRDASGVRRHRTHYDVIVYMPQIDKFWITNMWNTRGNPQELQLHPPKVYKYC